MQAVWNQPLEVSFLHRIAELYIKLAMVVRTLE